MYELREVAVSPLDPGVGNGGLGWIFQCLEVKSTLVRGSYPAFLTHGPSQLIRSTRL